MTHLTTPRSPGAPATRAALAATLLGALLAGPALAATPDAATPARSAIEATYRSDRAACLAGRTSQDRATCLKEAGAARSEALRGNLDNHETRAQRRANALLRCDAQPAAERAACARLARGEGRSDGSVAEGAVIRETVTRSVGSASAPAAPAAAALPAAPLAPAASAPR